jgi:hypothetical protein
MANTINGHLRIYSCGGAGVNLAANYVNAAKEPFAAEVHPVFIDSNLDKRIPDDSRYILPDLDGSGKVRAENYDKIKDVIKQIVHQHKPMGLNVVLSSASGGSGSVISALLIGELLARGEVVVAIIIGSDESAITAQNTLNTLKSLEGVSKNAGKPIVMFYRHNTRGRARSEVDGEIHYAISTLAVLASGSIKGLDTKDIANWIGFDKTTSVGARVAALEIFHEKTGHAAVPWNQYNPISVISIYKDADQATLPIVPEYHCDGFADVMGMDAIHYLIDVTAVPKYAAVIQATVKELEEARQSRPSFTSLISSDDRPKDDGIIL